MIRRSLPWSALTLVLAMATSTSARAASPTCSQLDIIAVPEVEARWSAIEDEVRDAFAARGDVDRCAHVFLVANGDDAIAEVTLPDGRRASRAVARREDVVPALEALLLVPASAAELARLPADENVPASEAVNARANGAPIPAESPTRLTVAASERAPSRDAPSSSFTKRRSGDGRVRFELSAVTGARIGDGQVGVGIGAQSFLDASNWLVGFGGRADGYRTLGSPSNSAVLEIALLGGRRIWLGQNVSWDFVLGPAAVLEGTSTYEAQTPDGHVSSSSSGAVPRLVTGTRLTFAAHSLFRSFLGLDGEVGPYGRDDEVPNAPRLPIWTLGLAVGATVGTP